MILGGNSTKDYLPNRTIKDMEELIGEIEDKAQELKEDNANRRNLQNKINQRLKGDWQENAFR